MDIDDLKKFLVVADCNNLQQAAVGLNLTPGALSKVIKRIEHKLNTELFDRSGRNIIINQHGEKFRQYAVNLVHEAEQAMSEFGSCSNTQIKLSGPSVLLSHYAPLLVESLVGSELTDLRPEFNIDVVWEGKAINQVATGQSHLALVTAEALSHNQHNGDYKKIPLGQTCFKVVAAKTHAIFSQFPNRRVTSEQLYSFAFACPSVSPFCGIKRGVGSDGWRDDKVPRTIGFRCNEFGTLLGLVKSGLALAYVPDFIAEHNDLVVIDIIDCDYVCTEDIELVYKPSLASGWLNKVAAVFRDIQI